MRKRFLVLGMGLVVGVLSLGLLVSGCGQQQVAEQAPTTAATGSVIIKGGTSITAVAGLGLKAQATTLPSAEVTISIPTKGGNPVKIASGTTDANGTFSISVVIASLETVKSANNYAANLLVEISKEGTVLGCVVSSISLEANKINYAPTADLGGYSKQKIVQAACKKGVDPKTFDYNENIEEKFSSSTLQNYGDTKIDQIADSLKAGEDTEDEIAQGLGISLEVIAQIKQKGMELHKIYVEPLLKQAHDSSTSVDRTKIDLAFSSMEAAIQEYAKSLGVTEQQIADFKAMKNQQTQTKMQEKLGTDDKAFEEAKRRIKGSKIIDLFLGQYEAGKVIANVKISGKQSFAEANSSAYSSFIASKEVIVNQLNSFLNATLDLRQIPDYLRLSFFDAFIFPPASAMPSVESNQNINQQQMDQMMLQYTNSRILVYFMKTFFNQEQMTTFYSTMESSMKRVFANRFNDTSNSSGYYMGESFWNSRPTAEQIKDRLEKFNAALTAAIDNNTTVKDLLTNIFGTETSNILKAFRILAAPPDMF